MTNTGKRKIKDYLSITIDTIYNNGNPVELDIRRFLMQLDNRASKGKIDFLISAILATDFVEPVKEFDIDLGDNFDTGDLKMSNNGMIELIKYGTFLGYWNSPRQKLNRIRYNITLPFMQVMIKINKTLTPLNTLSTIILSLVTAFLLIKADNKDSKVEQISKDKTLLIQIVDSLNRLIILQQNKIQTLEKKDSVRKMKTLP